MISIRRVLKAIFCMVAILLFSILMLRTIGMLTDQESISNSQLRALLEVDDKQNAYLLINDLVDQPGFNLDEDRQAIETLVDKWNSGEAAGLLKRQQAYLELVEHAASKTAFKSTALTSTELPNFLAMRFLSMLPQLKARLLAEQGDYQQAAKYLAISLKFNDHITRDASATLISYLVGQSLQTDTLNQITALAQSNELPDKVLTVLGKELDRLSHYSEDGFDLVWSGEHIYSALLLDEMLDASFLERLDYYSFNAWFAESWNADLFTVGLILIPEYVAQAGKLNNHSLKRWIKLQNQSDSLCSDLNFDREPLSDSTKRSWFQVLAPNGLAQAVYFSDPEVSQFDNHFHRRCLSNFHVNATRLLIAIKRYESRGLGSIESLGQLVPNYIDNLPIDPFSGQPIKYNSVSRYLYSYGENFSDDGGSVASLYFGECHLDDGCANNPTVAIDAKN